jgi:hypothetical protein
LTARTAWALYLGALAIPIVALVWLNASEFARWFATGICPGGPMDRAAAPCNAFEFASIVLLGGWAAFIVVPALLGWMLVATLIFRWARSRTSRELWRQERR